MKKKQWKPKVEYRNPETLIPYEKNAKIHTKEQIKKVAGAISKFGFTTPIVIDKDGIIIAGHCRREASLQLALKEVPVVIADHLTEEEVIAARIADNKVSEGAYNQELLKFELKTLELKNFEMAFTGFELKELESIFKDQPLDSIRTTTDRPDHTPAVTPDPPKPEEKSEGKIEIEKRVKFGESWALGKHTLHCTDFFTYVLDKDFDIVYTDPPYGIDEKTDRVKAKRGHATQSLTFKKIQGDETTDVAHKAFDICDKLSEILCFWGGNHYSLKPSACWLVWDKRVTDEQRDDNSDCELAYVKHPTKKSVRIFRHLWKGMIKGSEHGESRVHPTQKPIALAEWSLKELAPSAKTVLDCFAGSGSTLLACERLGMECTAFEIEPEYCDAILARFEKETGKKPKLIT